MVKHKYADAIKYCNVSVKANFLEPEHRINLALVYLERDDRKNAVQNLEAGLRLQPSNKRIHKIFREHRSTKSRDVHASCHGKIRSISGSGDSANRIPTDRTIQPHGFCSRESFKSLLPADG